jgi:hypothetical protein
VVHVQARTKIASRALVGAALLAVIAFVALRATSTGGAAIDPSVTALQTGPFAVNTGDGTLDPQRVVVALANVGHVASRGRTECGAKISVLGGAGNLIRQTGVSPIPGTSAFVIDDGDESNGIMRVRVDLTSGGFDLCLPSVTITEAGLPGQGDFGRGDTEAVIGLGDFVPALGKVLP